VAFRGRGYRRPFNNAVDLAAPYKLQASVLGLAPCAALPALEVIALINKRPRICNQP